MQKQKNILLLFTMLLGVSICKSQNNNTYYKNLKTVSPTAFQFVKYTEMPVNEYTGIPSIGILLYEINVDEVKIPLNLTYHAVGNKVSQEASWVGLGWDLSIGSIVQTVNDKEDYGFTEGLVNLYCSGPNYHKELPDYFPSGGDGGATILPKRYRYPNNYSGYLWSNPYPVNPVANNQQGYAVATDYYIPKNGDFNVRRDELFTHECYDSEPDYFVASFLGHSVKFALNFKSSAPTAQQQIVVLNKQGYKVSKNLTPGFTITTPDGDIFVFDEKRTQYSYSNSDDIGGYSTSNQYEPSSNVYFITKIITKNKKEITFEYNTTELKDAFVQYSDRLVVFSSPTLLNFAPLPPGGNFSGSSDGIYAFANNQNNTAHQGTLRSYSSGREKYTYLSRINFPSGKVDFLTSARNDINGGLKLDGLKVVNSQNRVIKDWYFDNSYFDASGTGGNGYDISQAMVPYSSLRLKLNAVYEPNGEKYEFIYNPAVLPKKNSFAQDYWGFYNGALTNVSLAPNPAVILGTPPWVGSNSNVRSANIGYTKAAILEEIVYPTGGRVKFDYELNAFDGTRMGLTSAAQPLVNGGGLRIKSIQHFTGVNLPTLRTEYAYEGGKMIVPISLRRGYAYKTFESYTIENCYIKNYDVEEYSANGVFSSNPFGSINGVAYNKVTKKNTDAANTADNGTVISEFKLLEDYNNPTIYNHTYPHCQLPSLKRYSEVENGSLLKSSIYNAQNQLVRKTENSYSVFPSPVYYGARIFPYGDLMWFQTVEAVTTKYTVPQSLIGYCPIYDNETLLTQTVITDYDVNSISMTTTVNYGYDGYHIPAFKQTRTSDGGYLEEYYDHAYEYYLSSGNNTLWNANWLTEVTKSRSQRRKANYFQSTDLPTEEKEFSMAGDKIVLSKLKATPKPGTNAPQLVTSFEKHDAANGNPLLVKNADGTANALIWDYKKEYVVAETKMGKISGDPALQVAYTSFEADGNGNFNIVGGEIIADANAPTGKYVYSLGQSISKTLNSGQNFILSFWANTEFFSVTVDAVNITGQRKKGQTINGYTYFEWELATPTNMIINGPGVTRFDELRVYPKGAQMTTYSYEPLVGITNQCDANNNITYYEYDALNRLKTIRDKDRNILKTFDYKYQQ
jgi:YD repeat-containing protein